MRELKFRVWDPAIPKTFTEAEDHKASGDMVNWEYVKKSSYLIDGLNGKYPMMQYTGVKDKNGVEIYEGDILRIFDKNYEVKVKIVGGYKVFVNYGFPDEHNGPCNYWSEVIGNIYENPELKEAADR